MSGSISSDFQLDCQRCYLIFLSINLSQFIQSCLKQYALNNFFKFQVAKIMCCRMPTINILLSSELSCQIIRPSTLQLLLLFFYLLFVFLFFEETFFWGKNLKKSKAITPIESLAFLFEWYSDPFIFLPTVFIRCPYSWAMAIVSSEPVNSTT